MGSWYTWAWSISLHWMTTGGGIHSCTTVPLQTGFPQSDSGRHYEKKNVCNVEIQWILKINLMFYAGFKIKETSEFLAICKPKDTAPFYVQKHVQNYVSFICS